MNLCKRWGKMKFSLNAFKNCQHTWLVIHWICTEREPVGYPVSVDPTCTFWVYFIVFHCQQAGTMRTTISRNGLSCLSTRISVLHWNESISMVFLDSHQFARYWHILVEISCFVHFTCISTFSCGLRLSSSVSKVFRFKRNTNKMLKVG